MAWTPFDFFEYDPEKIDFSKTTFNIKQALNNNWAHIRNLIEELRGASADSVTEGALTAALSNYSRAPVITEGTLSATKWNGSEYSFEDQYPAASYEIEIQPNYTCSEEQIVAYGDARLMGRIDLNVITSGGDVPTVDIPVIIKVVAK